MRLFSPVLYKEMIQLAAGRKVTVLKGLVLAVIMLVFLGMLAAQSSGDFSRGTAGRDLFMGISIATLLVAAVFVPILAAGMVCGEREARTLGLLFLTRLRSWQIVQDKGLSRVALMLLLCLTVLPFLSAAMLFGGVERAHLVAAAGNVLAMVLLAGGISLMASTRCRRLLYALVVAYAVLFLYLVGVPMILILADMAGGQFSMRLAAALNPVFSIIFLADVYELQRDPWLLGTWRINLAIGAAVYAAAVLASSLLVRRLAWSDGADGRAPGRAGRGRKLGAMTGLRCSLLDPGLSTLARRISLVAFVCFWGTALVMDVLGKRFMRHSDFNEMAYSMGMALMGLMAALAASSVFARQREAGTFDLLLTTRLSGRTLVLGALAGLARVFWPIWVLLLFPVAVNAWAQRSAPILIPIMNVAIYFGFILVLGLFLSLRCRTSVRAAGWTMGVLLFVVVGIPLLMVLIHEFDRTLSEFVFMWSPVYWVVEGMNSRGYHDFGGYAGWFAVSTVYVLAAAGLLGYMMTRFDRLTGRQPAGAAEP